MICLFLLLSCYLLTYASASLLVQLLSVNSHRHYAANLKILSWKANSRSSTAFYPGQENNSLWHLGSPVQMVELVTQFDMSDRFIEELRIDC